MNGKSWYAIIRRGQSWYVSTATNLRGLGRMMILQIENLLYRFLTSLFRSRLRAPTTSEWGRPEIN